MFALRGGYKCLNKNKRSVGIMGRGEAIEKRILEVLKKAENPMSTREIGLKIGRAWHSIQNHCLRLQIKGKVHGFRVGNMNLWVIKR